jgi:hypothetical protein
MAEKTRQGQEGILPLKVRTWTSIKTEEVLRSVPPLDEEIKPLFSTDAARVEAFGRIYIFFQDETKAYYDKELRQNVVYREFGLEYIH